MIPVFFIFLFIISVIFILNSLKKWDSRERFSIIVAGGLDKSIEDSSLYIFSVEPGTSSTVIRIPGNTLFDVPFGYSTYPASSVYKLGHLEGAKEKGGKLLLKSAETTLGMTLNGYLIIPENIDIKNSDDLNLIRKNFRLISAFLRFPDFMRSFLKTDRSVSVSDLISLWRVFGKLRKDEIRFMDLNLTGALIEVKLPDNTAVQKVDPEILDSVLSVLVFDSKVRNGGLTFEVSNASDQNRLASRFGRILKNLGADVLVTSTSKSNEKFACEIKTNVENIKDQTIMLRLVRDYRCKISEDPGFDNGATDVKIILGEEFMK